MYRAKAPISTLYQERSCDREWKTGHFAPAAWATRRVVRFGLSGDSDGFEILNMSVWMGVFK